MKKIWLVVLLIACFGSSVNFAQAETVEKQTAEGLKAFETNRGGAAAAQDDWAEMTIAGYRYEPGRMALGWQFEFIAKKSDIKKVEVWDITQAPAQLLISQDNIQLNDNKWYGSTELKDITLKSEPWLRDKKPTERFYKIILTNANGETRTLYQMAIYNREMKNSTVSMMKGNYIHVRVEK